MWPGVAEDAVEPQTGCLVGGLCEGDGRRGGRHARAAHADIEIDEHADRGPGGSCSGARGVEGYGGVCRDPHPRPCRQSRESPRARSIHGRIGHQEVGRPIGKSRQQGFRLTHLGNGEPTGARGQLQGRDLDALVRLCMGSDGDSVACGIGREPIDVATHRGRVEDDRGSGDLADFCSFHRESHSLSIARPSSQSRPASRHATCRMTA
jgi:hypothetical protein